MEFDVSKVYTAMNAEKLKPGCRVIVADSLECLKYRVEHDSQIETLTGICSTDAPYRFSTNEDYWNLAYLVEEHATLKWTDLKIGDVIRKGDMLRMVTGIDLVAEDYHIFTREWLDDEELELWEKVEDEV